MHVKQIRRMHVKWEARESNEDHRQNGIRASRPSYARCIHSQCNLSAFETYLWWFDIGDEEVHKKVTDHQAQFRSEGRLTLRFPMDSGGLFLRLYVEESWMWTIKQIDNPPASNKIWNVWKLWAVDLCFYHPASGERGSIVVWKWPIVFIWDQYRGEMTIYLKCGGSFVNIKLD